MKAPAIIASLTVVGSIAYATGSQGVAAKQPPVMPSGSQAHSMQEEIPQTRMQMAGVAACDAEPWFAPIPHPFVPTGCGSPAFLPLKGYNVQVDINGDGVIDFLNFEVDANSNSVGWCEEPGGWNPGIVVRTANQQVLTRDSSNLVTATRFDSSNGDLAFVTKAVFPSVSEQYASWIPDAGTNPDSNVCNFYNYGLVIYLKGFLDCDGDRDLDLIAEVRLCKSEYLPHPNTGICQRHSGILRSETVWFENTGFQHTNPIAADLNRDGRVNGADLSLLLVSWGETQ
jgi:hypothetical protein